MLKTVRGSREKINKKPTSTWLGGTSVRNWGGGNGRQTDCFPQSTVDQSREKLLKLNYVLHVRLSVVIVIIITE